MSPDLGYLYEFGEFRLDPLARRLLKGTQIVSLTPKAVDLLLVLVENRRRVLGREELMQEVWPDTFVEEGNLTQTISVLRKAIGPRAGDESYIETVPRQGYRFTGIVSEVARPTEQVPMRDRSNSRPVVAEVTGKSRRHLGAVVGTLAVLLACAGAWYLSARKPARALPGKVNSIVVLPFLNLSSDRDNEYFSDGLTEELIDALSRIDGLRVVARTTAFSFKGKPQDVRSIGRQLGVAAVLEGSVRKEQNWLRVTAQLNSVTDGYHFWSETYDRELKDVFAIQEDIARAIRQALRQNLDSDLRVRAAGRPPTNLEAYNLYLQGRFQRHRDFGPPVAKAIAFFQEAIGKDPAFAEAYAAMAEVYGHMAYTMQMPPKQAFAKAAPFLRSALKLNDSLAEAHTSQAIGLFLYEWNWAAAEQEFLRAISLNPDYAEARHWYSHYLVAMGRLKESLEQTRLALELDPLDLDITAHRAWNNLYARDYQGAVDAARKSLEIDPHHASSLAYLSWAFEESGEFDRAIDTWQGMGAKPELVAARRLALKNGGTGYWRMRLRQDLQDPQPNPYFIAQLYARLGDASRASEWLDRAYELRHSWLVYLNTDPAFDAIRGDRRFAGMVKRVGLPVR